MAKQVVCPRVAWLVAFFALFSGVMADRIDDDLVGVIAASACVFVILVIIISIVACYFNCWRYKVDRNSSLLIRKNSGSVSTHTANNGLIAARWVSNSAPYHMPVYTVPAKPMVFAMPATPYYLGNYAPRFLDAEELEYTRHQRWDTEEEEEHKQEAEEQEHTRHTNYVHVKRVSGEEEERPRQTEQVHVTRVTHEEEERPRHTEHVHVTRVTREEEERPRQAEHVHVTCVTREEEVQEAPPQPDGQLTNEFAASSVNYRVIRKQHDKHEKMPEWITKGYEESERTMTLDDEVSVVSAELTFEYPPARPEEMVRAQVFSRTLVVHPEDRLTVPEDYSFIDFVDPEERPRPSSHVQREQHDEDHRTIFTTYSGGGATVYPTNDATTTTTTYTASEVLFGGPGPSSRVLDEQREEDRRTVLTTYTGAGATGYPTPDVTTTTVNAGEVISGSREKKTIVNTTTIVYAEEEMSTSTPSLMARQMLSGMQDGGVDTAGSDSTELSHYRMRRANEGIVGWLPVRPANDSD